MWRSARRPSSQRPCIRQYLAVEGPCPLPASARSRRLAGRPDLPLRSRQMTLRPVPRDRRCDENLMQCRYSWVSCKDLASWRVVEGVRDEFVMSEEDATVSDDPDFPEAPVLLTSVADLYRESYGEMVRLARLLVGSPEVAADLVQDAFVEIHRRWADLERPAAYLRQSVVNRCRGYHRRRLTERDGMRKLSSPATSDNARELTDAIAHLRYRERAAIVLRYYADLPDADIAELLGCRPGTVASLVHRGLERLRKVIEP